MNSPIFRRRHESRFIFLARSFWDKAMPYVITAGFALLYALMFAIGPIN